MNFYRILSFCALITIVTGLSNHSYGQTSPQIYNNFFVGWPISEKWSLRNELSYNFLYENPASWNEISLSSFGAFRAGKIIETTGGIYASRTQQNKELSNYELRPVIGFRIFNGGDKRYSIGNYSRFEFRFLLYSDDVNDATLRFRNRTTAAISFNRPAISDSQNLFMFSYFEVFNNFEDDTRERFFKQWKAKLGIGYRISDNWLVDFGTIYLDSRNNIPEGAPSQLPSTVQTNYVVEWQLAYLINRK